MPDHIRELLHRNLQEVFGKGNAARRRGAMESFYAEDCVLYAPPGIFVGPEALDKFAGDPEGDICLCSTFAPSAHLGRIGNNEVDTSRFHPAHDVHTIVV